MRVWPAHQANHGWGIACEDQVIFALLDRWWKEEGASCGGPSEPEVELELRILDMAAGR
jgi:hypothetical protein